MSANLDENKRTDIAQLLDLPPRVARIETHIEYIRTDVAELKGDLKELRDEMTGEFKSVRAEIKEVRSEMASEFKSVRSDARTDFRLLFGALIAVALGLAGMIAHGFHWIG